MQDSAVKFAEAGPSCATPASEIAAGDDRTTKAAKTALVTLVQTFVSLAVGLVSVPILVQSLGRDVYGVWLLIGQAISYLALVDFGNASIAKLKLASLASDDETEGKQEVLTTTLLGILVTTPIVALVGVAIAAWACRKYTTASLSFAAIAWSSAFLVAAFLVMRISSLPTFALFGANMEYRSAFGRLLITTANSVLDIVAALLGCGMVGLAANRLLAQLGLAFNLQRAAKRYVRWYGFTAFDWSKVGPLLRQNAFCLFAQWGNTLVEAVDILVVGIAVGADAVPMYTITAALPRLLFMLFYQAISGANAGLVGLFGSGDKKRFHFVRSQQEIVTLACLAVVGAVTLAVNRRFVGLWVGPEYYGGAVLTAVAMVWYFAVITSRQFCSALSAALDFNRMARVQVAAGIAGCVAGVVGGGVAGITGAIGGILVVRLVANLLNARRLDDLLDIRHRDHVAALALPLIVAATSCAGGWAVGRLQLPNDWIMTSAVGAAVMATAGATAWFLGMPATAKDDLIFRIQRLARLLPRLPGSAAA